MPSLERYDGSGDPNDHVQSYHTSMKLQGANDPLLCLAFPTTLKKAAREWYNKVHSFFQEFVSFFPQSVCGYQEKKEESCPIAYNHSEGGRDPPKLCPLF